MCKETDSRIDEEEALLVSICNDFFLLKTGWLGFRSQNDVAIEMTWQSRFKMNFNFSLV